MRDLKKVWVWDRNKKNAEQRIFISELENGDVLCVSRNYEYEYEARMPMTVKYWASWSETNPSIKEKRWMTREEILLDNLDHPRRLVRYGKKEWNSATDFRYFSRFENHEYIDIPENYKGDFSDLEAKKYEVEE